MHYDWNFWVMEWGCTSFGHAHDYLHKKKRALNPYVLPASIKISSVFLPDSYDVIFYISFQMLFPFQGSSCQHTLPLPLLYWHPSIGESLDAI